MSGPRPPHRDRATAGAGGQRGRTLALAGHRPGPRRLPGGRHRGQLLRGGRPSAGRGSPQERRSAPCHIGNASGRGGAVPERRASRALCAASPIGPRAHDGNPTARTNASQNRTPVRSQGNTAVLEREASPPNRRRSGPGRPSTAGTAPPRRAMTSHPRALRAGERPHRLAMCGEDWRCVAKASPKRQRTSGKAATTFDTKPSKLQRPSRGVTPSLTMTRSREGITTTNWPSFPQA